MSNTNTINTSFSLNESEKIRIREARAKCPVGDDYTNVNPNGNLVPLYTTLSTIIGERIASNNVNADDLAIIKSNKLWLDVAIGANGGTGMHSMFIRTYTDRQGELRLGRKFTDQEMQKASNGVALNYYIDLNKTWKLPTINRLAEADAESIGRNLFKDHLSDNDTAITSNAAWSGTLGFNLLGGSTPFETWRLVSASEVNKKNGIANCLDDFKNILYAYDSYNIALKSGYISGGINYINYLFTPTEVGTNNVIIPDDIQAQINISVSSGEWGGLITSITKSTPIISKIIQAISSLSPSIFLDMLMGAREGQNKLGYTDESNFNTHCQSFFNGLTLEELSGLEVKLLTGSANDLYTQSLSDVNVRAALVAGSMMSVAVSPSVANSQELSLYNNQTKQGNITQEFLKDKAEMLNWMNQFISNNKTIHGLLSNEYEVDTIQGDFDYINILSNGQEMKIAIDGKDTSLHDHQIVFGSKNNDTIKGRGDTDKLYGGAGDDIISGGGQNDYIEGNIGNDKVIDADGLGQIWIDGQQIKSGSV